MIRVMFFGPVAERIGSNAMQVDYRPEMSLGTLRDELAAKYPHAFEIVCFMAVDGEHVRNLSLPLTSNSKVAFMARFSGG